MRHDLVVVAVVDNTINAAAATSAAVVNVTLIIMNIIIIIVSTNSTDVRLRRCAVGFRPLACLLGDSNVALAPDCAGCLSDSQE